jgi:adenylate cyclase
VRRKYRLTALLLALSFVLAYDLFLWLPGVFSAWNEQVFDQLLAFRARSARFKPAYDDTIVHVDINNTSLKQIGQFYLDRGHYARAVRNLGEMGVAAQVYDFVFAVPQSEDLDRALVTATSEAANVYYGVAFALSDESDPASAGNPEADDYLAKTAWRLETEGGARDSGIRFGVRPLMTFQALAAASRGLGSLTIEPDPDGVIRRVPLILRYGAAFYPSLPLRVVCDYLHVPDDRIVVRPGHSITLQRADSSDIVIPIDARGYFRINFIGAWDRMRHYNFSDVYHASEDRDELDLFRDDLSGRIVVVADVSANSRDVGSVPTDREFPLSGLLANVMHNILTRSFLRDVTSAEAWLADVVLLACVFVFAVRLRPLPFSASVAGLTGVYLAFVILAFLYFQALFPIVRTLLMLSFAVTSTLGYRYIVEERDKTFVRRTFEAYFPPKVVKRIMADPRLIAGAGERKELTILFSDIVGFTKRASALPPDRIQGLLNEYFEAMVEIVFRHEGTVDKFIGDGLMVFCGDPEPQPDHAIRCVRMAIDMQQKTREISTRWEQRGEPPLQVRIGINTGVVVVGNMGSARRLSYTVLGSPVNLAQRLEANAPVGGILIAQRTRELLEGAIPTRSTGTIAVKGLDEPVEVYEVLENGQPSD